MNGKVKTGLKIGLGVAKIFFPAVAQIDQDIQGLKKGHDRKAATLKLAADSPDLANLLAGKKIVDPAKFQDALSLFNDATVALLQSLADDADAHDSDEG